MSIHLSAFFFFFFAFGRPDVPRSAHDKKATNSSFDQCTYYVRREGEKCTTSWLGSDCENKGLGFAYQGKEKHRHDAKQAEGCPRQYRRRGRGRLGPDASVMARSMRHHCS